MSSRLSREKINFLSQQILDLLTNSDQVEFLDDPNEIRLIIVKAIEEEMRLYEIPRPEGHRKDPVPEEIHRRGQPRVGDPLPQVLQR